MRLVAYILAVLCALSIIGSAPAGADPGSNQLTTWSALCNGKTEGVFAWSGATPANCTSLPNRIITWPDFTANVTHTGTGCGTGNPLPTWSQLLTCRGGGSGSTQVSQAFNGTGALQTTDGTTCSSAGGASTLTFTTPSNTVAPTTVGTEVKLAISSVAQWTADTGPATGTGISYTLAAPGGTIVTSGSVSNGNSQAPFYWGAGAAAGSYVWTITGLGVETCLGTAPNKTVHDNTAEQFSSTAYWSQ